MFKNKILKELGTSEDRPRSRRNALLDKKDDYSCPGKGEEESEGICKTNGLRHDVSKSSKMRKRQYLTPVQKKNNFIE